MKRVNKILSHSTYNALLERIKELEQERIFCKHDLVHFLDVCRIGWILSLEEEQALEKEVVYASGLLHDVGRWSQYETGEDHALASARECVKILKDCSFTDDEIKKIQDAIIRHRKEPRSKEGLPSILYRADKLSRRCFACDAIGACKRFQHGEEPYLQY
ncbi:HD domain-containing protein [Alkalibacter rhizosphaerae]|uniref:HD domain-containing protein n=1 Tax=Alkalibacter rhizosphaerae TaxID=2815577 RepID=A0A974XF30_9FIRM|nr:HD domain-containing protein [Alkalibacter rhizosphaerae]QSX08526.1 HD domain-containing protein [Alkalibacter rhizosphaerae]